MRLSVQGCLILWLCLFSAAALSATPPGTYRAYHYNYGHSQFHGYGSAQSAIQAGADVMCRNHDSNEITQTETYEPQPTGEYRHSKWRVECLREGSSPATYYWSAYYNNPPSCPEGEVWDPATQQCTTGPKEPEECYENGEIYDAQNQQCVQSCPEGSLNGVCLELPANNEENCNADSPDYQGFIGNGNTKMNLCESNRQCEGGAFGVVNGTPACIPDEYGPPTCDVSTVAVLDEYGFVCADPQDAPEPGQEPDEWWKDEEPNTDTDGDGEPDEYDPGNDPTSVDKGINQVNQGVSETNDKLDGANDRLDKIGKGIAKSNELQDEANGVADDARNTLKELNDKLDAPEDGFNTEGLLGIPTLTETATSFKGAVLGNELIQSVSGLKDLPSHTSCPVWTIPATDYWEAKPMNVHCDILEDYRGTFSVIFMFFWTGIAIYAFLRA